MLRLWSVAVSGGEREVDCEVEDFAPSGLKGLDTAELIEWDRDVASEGGVWSEEVVVCDEEDCEGECSIPRGESARGKIVFTGYIKNQEDDTVLDFEYGLLLFKKGKKEMLK